MKRTVSGGKGQSPECCEVEASVMLTARALQVGCTGCAGGGPERSEGGVRGCGAGVRAAEGSLPVNP